MPNQNIALQTTTNHYKALFRLVEYSALLRKLRFVLTTRFASPQSRRKGQSSSTVVAGTQGSAHEPFGTPQLHNFRAANSGPEIRCISRLWICDGGNIAECGNSARRFLSRNTIRTFSVYQLHVSATTGNFRGSREVLSSNMASVGPGKCKKPAAENRRFRNTPDVKFSS